MNPVTRTFVDELTEAHRAGDEDRLNMLLDMQAGIKAELRERIKAANDSAANFAHQLHAIGNLLDAAREHEMSVEDGDAPLLKGVGVATSALQEWMGR